MTPRRAVHAAHLLRRRREAGRRRQADLAGKEVVVPCMVDGNKDAPAPAQGQAAAPQGQPEAAGLQRQARLRRPGAATARTFEEFKTYRPDRRKHARLEVPARRPTSRATPGASRTSTTRKWRSGKAPIGYGEDEIAKRKGTIVKEQGVSFVFRRAFDVPADLLTQKGVDVPAARGQRRPRRRLPQRHAGGPRPGGRPRVRLLEPRRRNPAQARQVGPQRRGRVREEPPGQLRHLPRHGDRRRRAAAEEESGRRSSAKPEASGHEADRPGASRCCRDKPNAARRHRQGEEDGDGRRAPSRRASCRT